MRLILAPMEGLADSFMRDLLARLGGLDFAVAEFVRVSDSLLPQRTFLRLCPELRNGGRTACGMAVRVQLLGNDPACLADNAARAVELGAPGIDLNFGCPAPTVNRHRGGAILLQEPELIHAIVRAVRRAVPARVPVTAKMRLGFADTSPAVECAQAVEAGGAEELTVHARTRADGYRPPARWECLADVRQAVGISVIANGDVWTPQDWQAIRQISGCEDVMLGRGIVTRPDLAKRIRHGSATMTWPELLPWVADYYAQVRAHADPRHAPGRLKQWLGMLAPAYPEADALYRLARPERDLGKLAELLESALT